jgi:hypothetical protein
MLVKLTPDELLTIKRVQHFVGSKIVFGNYDEKVIVGMARKANHFLFVVRRQ